ncbi:LysR family transcriptional regulator [Pseudomaricurvus sp. HS19]|uniref:LysR family transcriptional regulator n=1 Tax=Pseudomaricurvus sp. HS19 TaxID=2692626 RepID=UPI001371DD26|nr:LysR family transcriptional regulator [Pseudomaricurvus sp. HS19]MYM62687.1 LysR family transcriptional regulator [Pseudomaricurvus sp. HS19]
MNWDDLRVFLAVARCGSLSGAGQQLGLQHTTVSRRLRAMEAGLGVRVLERCRGGYGLTTAGESLKATAERVEKEILGSEDVLLGRDRLIQGPLRVTVVNHIAYALLMPMFAGFSQRYPEVELQIQASNAYISMPHREADVALRVIQMPEESLIGKKIITFASAIYGSREYLSRLRQSGEPPDWLGTECCNFHRNWTRSVCPDGNHHFTIDDTNLAHMAIKQGVGLSFLPCFIGDKDPDLERYEEQDPATYGLDLWMLFHEDLRHTMRVRVFREYMVGEIEKQRDLLEGRAHRNT